MNWPVTFDSHVRGRISDASGNPLPDMFLVFGAAFEFRNRILR